MASSEVSRRLAAAVAALALVGGCASTPRGEAGPGSSSSSPALAGLPLQPTRGEAADAAQLVAGADATVFVFWSAGCPCVRRYRERIDALAQAWGPRGVAFVEVASNAGESLESLREAERLRSLRRPLWRDEGGRLARQLGARSTPTVVLVRRDGAVLYRGWVDNERLPGEADREAWLEAALDGFASGRPFAAKSPTWGCTITRSLSAPEAPSCHVPSPEVASSPATSPGGTP